jgi:hypothetical protein
MPDVRLTILAVAICATGPALAEPTCIGRNLNPAWAAHSSFTAEALRDFDRLCREGRWVEQCVDGKVNPVYVEQTPELFPNGVQESDRRFCRRLAAIDCCRQNRGVPIHTGMLAANVRGICEPDEVTPAAIDGHHFEKWAYRIEGGGWRYLTFKDGILTVIQGVAW